MNTQRLSPQEFAAVMDDAKLRAQQLRREAIDAFWSAMMRRVLPQRRRAQWQASCLPLP